MSCAHFNRENVNIFIPIPILSSVFLFVCRTEHYSAPILVIPIISTKYYSNIGVLTY